MDWLEDWEYPNDHIYAMERQKDNFIFIEADRRAI